MRILRRVRRSTTVVLLLTFPPACYHYVAPRDLTPQEYVAAKHPNQVRVTLADSSRVVLRDPWVSADSLGGRRMVQDARGALQVSDPRWAVPLSEVSRLEGHEYNNWGVAGIIAGTLVVAGGVLLVVAVNALQNQ
jgi:hypothetical protein